MDKKISINGDTVTPSPHFGSNGVYIGDPYPLEPADYTHPDNCQITVEDYLEVINQSIEPVETIEEDITITGKESKGKAQIHLVPYEIMFDCAEVREYAIAHKYKDPNNWKKVDVMNYIDAAIRHLLKMLEDPKSLDDEDKIAHYKHAACNLAFICHLLKEEKK